MTAPCWSCDAPDSPRHECVMGHVVYACEEQCRIIDRVDPVAPSVRGRTVPHMQWEDCPVCQDEVNAAMASERHEPEAEDHHDYAERMEMQREASAKHWGKES